MKTDCAHTLDGPADDEPSSGEGERFASVEEILSEVRAGRPVVIVDAADRENEGDLVIAAQFADHHAINFMARHARGLVCLALTQERAHHLQLPRMTRRNRSRHRTAFTVSIEAASGVTTGISARDRARTIATAIDPTRSHVDLVSPGHVFPIIARRGGVRTRAGHTEAAVDIARLAGLTPAGVICEIMNDDGTMARVPDLLRFCRQHGMRMGTIADLVSYRIEHNV
jgi:3,4-dihydroxy 2-butanone 4-phosphate synthase/GTP cyclohydrolase II